MNRNLPRQRGPLVFESRNAVRASRNVYAIAVSCHHRRGRGETIANLISVVAIGGKGWSGAIWASWLCKRLLPQL